MSENFLLPGANIDTQSVKAREWPCDQARRYIAHHEHVYHDEFLQNNYAVEIMWCRGFNNPACEHCGKGDEGRPAIFKGERFCSDNCRKALGLDYDRQHNELHPPETMLTELEKQLINLVGYLVPSGRGATEVPDIKTQIYVLSLAKFREWADLGSTSIAFDEATGSITVENRVK